jgi:membrane protein involved in colicin uptake
MTPNFEQVVETIQKLSAAEQERVLRWLEEKKKPQRNENNWDERTEKFHLAMRWIEENREKYLGKWVCLDGDKLISSGVDAKKVFAEAKANGTKIPFIEQIREEESSPIWGGFD